MAYWSTDDIAVSDRFAHWREVRAKNIYGVTAELERSKRAAFRGIFSAQQVGTATIGEMHASSYEVTRSEIDIARASSDSLCIYEQLDGACWFGTPGSEFVVGKGQLALSHSDLPYRTAPTTEGGFHLRLVKIPFAQCRDFVASPSDLMASLVVPEPGIDALFTAYFRAFVAQAPHLKGAAAETAIQALAQLALVARGVAKPLEEPTRDALRAARLEQARQIIENNLGRADLTPATVAVALGISTRQLHLLFAPTGISFTRYVLGRRLERARALLARDRRRSVLDIALACGIDSSTVFYRGFRNAYGMSPTDYRQSLAEASSHPSDPR
ncbi:AraC family transcriptional regulator [Aquabacter sp. CN5-332]|uniref:helix-turn-helix transcriptional regulator n=1 Tax=Aquabacter sp. CN5-332 TaxID=3156608 RepID=UPI0032B49104